MIDRKKSLILKILNFWWQPKLSYLAETIIFALVLLAPSSGRAGAFSLGTASNFVLLGDANTFLVGNNSQITGNIGIGSGGRLTLSGGPFSLNGSIFFADPVVAGTNYKTSGTNSVSGVVQQNNALVSSALAALTTLYNTAFSVYSNPATTDLNPSGSVTIGPGNYNYRNVNINSDTITLNGGPNDYIIINVKDELTINHSTFDVTGGIPVDHILWNLIQGSDGGDATKKLTVDGANTGFAGVFLAVDRGISLGNDDGVGRFFGGSSSSTDNDFRFVSGVTVAAPPTPPGSTSRAVPEPASIFLLGLGLSGLALWQLYKRLSLIHGAYFIRRLTRYRP